jgi:hypothetical protein
VRNPFRKKFPGRAALEAPGESSRGKLVVLEPTHARRFVDRLEGVSILRSPDGGDFVLVNLDAVQAELEAFPFDPGDIPEYEREAAFRRAVNNPANWLHDPSTAPDARYAAFEIDRRLAQVKFAD